MATGRTRTRQLALFDCEDAGKWNNHQQARQDAECHLQASPHLSMAPFCSCGSSNSGAINRLGHISGYAHADVICKCWLTHAVTDVARACFMQCWAGELPSLEESKNFDAIFIGGSHYSAYEPLPWIDQLRSWIKSFIACKEQTAKMVAVCFGCQVGPCRALPSRCCLVGASDHP